MQYIDMLKHITNTWKFIIKMKIRHMYLDVNNLYGWKMSQKIPADGCKLEKNACKLNKTFIQNYNEDRDKG